MSVTCSLICVSLQKPDRDVWDNGLAAMQCALQLEKKVNQALLDLHKVASQKGDPHVSSDDLPLDMQKTSLKDQ